MNDEVQYRSGCFMLTDCDKAVEEALRIAGMYGPLGSEGWEACMRRIAEEIKDTYARSRQFRGTTRTHQIATNLPQLSEEPPKNRVIKRPGAGSNCRPAV